MTNGLALKTFSVMNYFHQYFPGSTVFDIIQQIENMDHFIKKKLS